MTSDGEFPRRVEIAVSDLLFDEQNPRLRNAGSSQREAMLRIAEAQGPKLVGLAAHVAQHGLNPAEAFIVIPSGKKYRVLDGNRRLSAIKALDTPAAFTTLPKSRVARLGQLNATAIIPNVVLCAVFRDAAQAEPYVSLKHLGSRRGEGLAKWSAEQKRRHENRIGGAKAAELQLLDFVRDAGTLSTKAQGLADSGNFPPTLLIRLLEAKDARQEAGIAIDPSGNVTTDYPRDQVLKPLTRFVEDIASKKVTSRSLNTAAQLADYFRKLEAAARPDSSTRGADHVSLANATVTPGAAAKAKRVRDRRSSSQRPYLIPSTVGLTIPNDRVHDIYLELKNKVLVDEAWNAAGALLRVFLELSISLYLDRHKQPRKDKDYWRPNWDNARSHLESQKTLDKRTLDRVEEAIFSKSTSFVTVNAIVHDPAFAFTGKELKALWARLEPLFVAIWP